MSSQSTSIRANCRRGGVGPLLLLLVTCLALGLAPAAQTANVETLLMPAPLAQPHAKLENDCTNCHNRTDRGQQSQLCLNCHKDIAGDVSARTGMHGRMDNAGTAGQCVACHSEHHGRNADIVGLSVAQFDHNRTDFVLAGAHSVLSCISCHRSGESFRKATGNCAACHQRNDYHDGQLGKACGDCHSQASWAGARFEHDNTDFALTGKHQALACGACHLGGRYRDAPRSCIGCHATDDAHRGQRGEACVDCHSTAGWHAARFDHQKETGFALLGGHSKLDCKGCHRGGRFDDHLPTTCSGCHNADDAHASRFGTRCQDCHDNTAWQPVAYDHAARTGFALLGAHARSSCNSCHSAPVAEQKLAQDCAGCHRALDPHAGKLPDGCDSCHGQENWRRDLSFDHDLTSFPLLGLHIVVSCAQCHRSLDFSGAPTGCNGCHAAQDVHKGALGPECDTCHSPNDWGIWTFDHGKQTLFNLTGAHGRISCASCHQQPPGTAKMSRDCVSCHRQEDRHLGQFGLQCDRCHTTNSFRGARIL
jgi:hypothetical protein